MPNVRNAAAILMALPDDVGSSLLAKLQPKQVEQVCIELARIEALSQQEMEDIIISFAEMNPTAGGRSSGSLDLASSLVQQALGKNAATTLENLRQTVEGTPFAFLRDVDPQNLVTFMVDEHPQTIALVLSHLPPVFGAEVIADLDTEKQTTVIRRIANMSETSPEVIAQVEEGLAKRMVSVMSQSFENAGGVPSVAEILNVTDRATERTLLENIGQEDPGLVDEIRRLMFVFEDINKLRDKEIQTILQNVDTPKWAMSLKGASEGLKEKILGNMSERAAKMLAEEIDFLGSVQVAEVEAVQQEVVDTIRRLEDAGEISTGSSDEDEAYVE